MVARWHLITSNYMKPNTAINQTGPSKHEKSGQDRTC